MNSKSLFVRFLSKLAIAATLLIAVQSAYSQYQYTTGHADIGIGYEGGALNPHWHVEDTYEYAPEDAVAVVSATISSPVGAAAALGIADGSPVWVCGKAAYQPNLGFGAEELVYEDWVGGTITLSLTGWSGPGEVGIFLLNGSSTSVVDTMFSTYSPASTLNANTLEMYAGDHLHYTFAFTEVGTYTLDFNWSGTHMTDGAKSGSGTFTFNAVPEPSAYSLAAIAMVVLLLLPRIQGHLRRV